MTTIRHPSSPGVGGGSSHPGSRRNRNLWWQLSQTLRVLRPKSMVLAAAKNTAEENVFTRCNKVTWEAVLCQDRPLDHETQHCMDKQQLSQTEMDNLWSFELAAVKSECETFGVQSTGSANELYPAPMPKARCLKTKVKQSFKWLVMVFILGYRKTAILLNC